MILSSSEGELKLVLQEGRVYIRRGEAVYCDGGGGPFRLLLRRGGQQVELWPDEMSWETSAGAVRGSSVAYRVGVALRGEVAPGGVINLYLNVSNEGGWRIDNIAWPHFSRLRHPRGRAKVTWPFHVGAEVPAEELPAPPGLILTYPVYASMQWVDLHDGAGGLYIGAHDDKPYLKWLSCWCEEEGIGLRFDYSDLGLGPGEKLELPPAALAVHDGDWHAGADIYRSFMAPRLDRGPCPDWFKRNPSHNTIVMKWHDAEKPRYRFEQLPGIFRQAREYGIGMLHVVGYMENGHDTDYPDYTPGECMGGVEGLSRAIGVIRRDGGRVSLYTNGRILDPDGPFGGHAPEWAVRVPVDHPSRRAYMDMWDHLVPKAGGGWDPRSCMRGGPRPWNTDGSGVEENWGRVLAVMCPGAAGWRHLLTSRLGYLQDLLRPDGFQVDQVAGCWAWPCYAEGHDHSRPGLAWSCYRRFARDMRDAMKAADPETFTWTEGVCDLMGESFDCLQANLGFSTPLAGRGEWMPELYRYTFPEQHVFFGDLSGDDMDELMHAILVGGAIHAQVYDWSQCAPGYREAIRAYLSWRSAETELLSGRIVAGASCSGGVACTQFACDGKVGLIGLRLDGSAPGKVEVEMPVAGRRPSRAVLYTGLARREAPFALSGDRISAAVDSDAPFLLVFS